MVAQMKLFDAIQYIESADIEQKLKDEMLKDMRTLLRKNESILCKPYLEGFCIYKLKHTKLITATIHHGHYVPSELNFYHTNDERHNWEDSKTGYFYQPLFLEKGGIFINVYTSRYFCDLNRPIDQACFLHKAPIGTDRNFRPTEHENEFRKKARSFYKKFYSAVRLYLQKSKILVSGHSMSSVMNDKERPDYCLIAKQKKDVSKLVSLFKKNGITSITVNDPFDFEGGYFHVYYTSLHETSYSYELEINKKLYIEYNRLSKEFTSLSEKVCSILSLDLQSELQSL